MGWAPGGHVRGTCSRRRPTSCPLHGRDRVGHKWKCWHHVRGNDVPQFTVRCPRRLIWRRIIVAFTARMQVDAV